jgi:hypothetical protein
MTDQEVERRVKIRSGRKRAPDIGQSAEPGDLETE